MEVGDAFIIALGNHGGEGYDVFGIIILDGLKITKLAFAG